MESRSGAAAWHEEHVYFERLLDLLESEVEAAAATYVLYYRNHIATEESEAVSRAAATLTTGEWQAVADSAAVIFDPLFGANPQERYRELLHYLGQKSS